MGIWHTTNPITVVRAYVQALDARDDRALEALIADEFELVDSVGNVIAGKEACLTVLRRLSALAPDYRIEPASMSRRGQVVLVSGKASSADPRLCRDSQWRARVEGGRLLSWEAFAAHPVSFNEILRDVPPPPPPPPPPAARHIELRA